MGYSHYWFQEHGAIEEPVWRRICNDVEKLIDACQVRLSATVNGSAPPIVDAEQIVFNGSPESEGYEAFAMHRVPKNHFYFCKTAGRPYDEVVCAVLAVAAEYAPSAVRVISDGPAENWQAPVGWASDVLGRSVPNPIL